MGEVSGKVGQPVRCVSVVANVKGKVIECNAPQVACSIGHSKYVEELREGLSPFRRFEPI